jgi:hypothetical protein
VVAVDAVPADVRRPPVAPRDAGDAELRRPGQHLRGWRRSSVTKLSDFYSARQWHSTGMYSDYGRAVGMEHELLLCLPAGPSAGPGRPVRLMLTRERGPDFSPRGRALLALLRPHLDQAYRDAERRRRGIPALTPRQWDLLNLVDAGHSNTQIARRLGLSPGDRPQAPGERLRPAAGLQPHRRPRPRVPRPDGALASNCPGRAARS